MEAIENNLSGARLHKNLPLQDDDPNNKSQIHQCLRFSMRISRWMGYFPVEGLDQPTISGLRYNLRGFYGIYYLVTILIGIVLAILNFIYFVSNKLTLETVDFFIYYTIGFTSMIILAHLSIQWPMFMRKVTEIEHQLQEIRTSHNTHKYCNIMASIVMIEMLVDFTLFATYNMFIAKDCMTTSNEISDILQEFFILNAPYYFQLLPYHHFTGVLFEVVHLQVAFLKSLTDMLIICCSIYLISYFQDLNKVINSRQNNIPWERLRVYYSRVVELVMQVNVRLSVFVLLSFVVHIFYICTQIFHILKASHSNSKLSYCDKQIVDKIHQSPTYLAYFVHSLWFLFIRFIIASLLAANVSIIAKKPLIALDSVTSPEYCLEVQRFRMQIQSQPIAMSGIFFSITRPMLLQVIGSIITYELVLLQFR